MRQAIQPGDQMWVNLASLIRDRVPDRKGNILPLDVSFGTYDLRDLSLGLGSLMPGGLVLDSTFGFRGAPPPYPPCCGTSSPDWGVDSFDLSVDDVSLDPIYATDTCNGDSENISGSFSDWWSGNTSIATVTNKAVTGVSAGTTTANASGVIFLDGCFEDPVQETAPVVVFDVGAAGKSYIFVGSDTNELYGNRYTVLNSALNGAPQPPGGTCCADSSDPSDSVTSVGTNEFQFQTMDQSATVGDRTLTFEYDLSGEGGTSVQKNVTARQFAYVTNNTPSNTCNLPYGTSRIYTYTVYTHPDHAALLPTDGLSNTAVTESFNPPLTCETGIGNKYLNTNAQFADNITSICSNAPLTCAQASTQTLSVAGYPVRTNTLQWTSTGVTYSSQGPTQ